MATLRAWYNSQEYQRIEAIPKKCATSRLIALDGTTCKELPGPSIIARNISSEPTIAFSNPT
jgi:uncharacterized protein DUF1330